VVSNRDLFSTQWEGRIGQLRIKLEGLAQFVSKLSNKWKRREIVIIALIAWRMPTKCFKFKSIRT
jgi:hypothetical protein